MTERGPWVDRMDDPVDEAAVHRVWRGVERHRHAAPVDPRVWGLGVGLATAVVVGLALWTFGGPAVEPSAGSLRHAHGAALEAGDRLTEHARLSDGSQIRPGRGAAVEVLESTATALTVVVEPGQTRFEVTPGGARRWTLECGLARVEVVGTVFTVDRSSRRVRVAVERGAVLVHSPHLPDGVTRVVAGGDVEVRAPAPRPTRDDDADPAPSRTEPAAPEPEAEPEPEPAASEPSPSSRPLSAWLADADEARGAGQLGRAERTLVEGLALHPRDPDRALAWFTLGRVRVQAGSDRSAAARAFDRALAEGLPRALVEEAMVRSVEAHARAGEREAAARVARAHRARFGASSRREEIDAWVPTEP